MIADRIFFRLTAMFAVATVSTMHGLFQADIITVDDDDPAADFTTIQEAVDVAVDGDVIEVGPGYYFNPSPAPDPVVSVVGKSIQIKATSGDPADTYIAGQASRRGVEWSGPATNCSLEGFTIDSGFTSGDGGGVLAVDVGITIIDCVFTSNSAEGDGGAIFLTSDAKIPPFVLGCRFEGNSAVDGGGIFSIGGIDLYQSAFVGNTASRSGGCVFITGTPPGNAPFSVVSECTFDDCEALYGGGMRTDDARVKVLRSSFANCLGGEEFDTVGWGGGVSAFASELEVEGTSFRSCTGGQNGGGIDLDRSTLGAVDTTFESCFTNGYGGAVNGLADSSSLDLTNCSFEDNLATGNGGGAIGCAEFDNEPNNVSALTMANCTFTGNNAWGFGFAIDAPNVITATDCTFGEQATGFEVFGAVAHVNIEGVGTGSTFERCSFTDAEAIDYASSIRAIDVGGLRFTDCVFERNETTNNGLGFDTEGTVYVEADPDNDDPIVFEGSTFFNNGACCLGDGFFAGTGGALKVTGRAITIAFCDIQSNRATSGGSISATATISNSIISGLSSLGYGGAAMLGSGSSLVDCYITGSADCNYPCLYASGPIVVDGCTIRGGFPENFQCGEDPADLAECRFVKGTTVRNTRFCRYDNGPINGPWTDLGGNTFNPDECNAADINGDGSVNGADLALVLASWGQPCLGCAADVNQDGEVNGADLALILAGWG